MLEEGSAIRAGITGLDATRPESINIGTALQIYFAEPGADEKKKRPIWHSAVFSG